MNNCVHDWGCWKREPLKSAKIIGLQFAPGTITSSRNCIKGNRSGIYRDAARHRSFPVTDCASRALQITFDRISPTTLTLPRAPGYSPTPRWSNEWKKKKKFTWLTLMLYPERCIDKDELKNSPKFSRKTVLRNGSVEWLEMKCVAHEWFYSRVNYTNCGTLINEQSC